MNYELRAIAGTTALSWNGVYSEADIGSRSLVVDMASAAVQRRSAVGHKVVRLLTKAGDLLVDGSPTEQGTRINVGLTAAVPGGQPYPLACGIQTTNTYDRARPEKFANVYGWSGAKGELNYGAESSHSLGVAVGGRQSGTMSLKAAAGATVKNIVDATAINKVNYRKYIHLCLGTMWRPSSFYGVLPSAEFPRVAHVDFPYCDALYSADSMPWKDKGTNVTFGTGVVVQGIGLSAQSGWSTGTRITFNVTSRTRICGSSSLGWASSAQISAKRG